MGSTGSIRCVSGAPCHCVVQTRTTNADSSLQRRRRSGFREFQDRHSSHCGEADERASGNYGQTTILSDGGVHVRLYLHTCIRAYRTVIISWVTARGQIRCRGTRRRGRKGRDLERRDQRRYGKRVRGVYERSVGERRERKGIRRNGREKRAGERRRGK